MPHDAGDPLATVPVTRDDLVRIGRALRLVEKLSREIVNHTPLNSDGLGPPRTVEMVHGGRPRADEPAVWPVEVTGDTTPSMSHPDLAELKLGTLYVPDPTTDPPWQELNCFVRALPGQTLSAGDSGIARLVGWRDADGTTAYESMPIYAIVPSSTAGSCTKCEWLAGMGTSRCLRVSVAGSLTDLYLSTTDGEFFTSPDLLTICGTDYTVTVVGVAGGMPQLQLTPTGSGAVNIYGMLKCCGCAYASWAVNLQAVCPGEPDTGNSCTNVLEVRVDGVACPGGVACDDTAGVISAGVVYPASSTWPSSTFFHVTPVTPGQTYYVKWTNGASVGCGLSTWANGDCSGASPVQYNPGIAQNGSITIADGATCLCVVFNAFSGTVHFEFQVCLGSPCTAP